MPDVVFSSKGAEKLIAEQERLNKKVAEGAANYKLTGREAAAYDRLVTKTIQSQLSDYDKLRKKIADITTAFQQAGASQEDMRKAITRAKIEYAKMHDAAKKTPQEHEKSKSAIGGIISKLGPMAAGYLTVHKAVALITDELRAQQELVDKAERTKITVAAARNVTRRNLLGMSQEEREAIVARGTRIAQDTNVSEVAIQQAIAEGISAGADIDQVVASTKLLAPFLADRPDEIGQAVGALTDLSKVTGSTDPAVNLGLLALTGKQGRVTGFRS